MRHEIRKDTHVVLHIKVHVLRAHLGRLVDGGRELIDAVLLEGQCRGGDAERGGDGQREEDGGIGCIVADLHNVLM